MNDRAFVVILRRLVLLAGIAVSVVAQPVLGSAAVDKARGFFDNGDLRAATIELKNALQADPGDAAARLLLGRIYIELRSGAASGGGSRGASLGMAVGFGACLDIAE